MIQDPNTTEDRESHVLGFLLEGHPDPIPEAIQRLIELAPESFTDGTHGKVAAAMRTRLHAGEAITDASVLLLLRDQIPSSTLAKLQGRAIPATLAEVDAQSLLDEFMAWKVEQIFAEGQEAVRRNPNRSGAVAEGVVKTLEHLDGKKVGRAALKAELSRRRFDHSKRPAPFSPVYTLAGVPIGTRGNICTIAAHIKSGKSAFVGAMIAASIVPEGSTVDCLGIQAANNTGKAVLHFDTEQSPEDHWHLVDRAVRRAELAELPAHVHSYTLTGGTPKECMALVREGLQVAAEAHGGIFAVIIDGVADLVNDVNDSEESSALVAELHAVAIAHDCPVVAIIHFNPSSGTGDRGPKTRGHLGSHLERKSETNLTLEKTDEIVEVYSTRQRGAPILKGKGPKFTWSDDGNMHVSYHGGATLSQGAQKLQPYMDEVFPTCEGRKYSALVSTVMTVMEISEKTAQRRIADAVKAGMIVKGVAGIYTKGTCE